MTDIEVTLETQTVLVPPITQIITLDDSDSPTIIVPSPVSVSVISAGPQGPRGSQGPQGIEGPTGPPGENDKKINFVFTANPNTAVDALTADPEDLCVDSWNRWWGIEHTPPDDPVWVPLNSDLRTQHVLGGAADLDVGSTAGTVAAGDDPRFSGVVAGWLLTEAGAVISTGVKKLWRRAEHNVILTGWRILSDGSVTCTIRPIAAAYSSFPPVSGTSVVGAGTAPSLSAAAKNESTTLTSWDTSWIEGDIFDVEVVSNSDATWLIVELLGTYP